MSSFSLSRRFFLKASLAGAAGLFCRPAFSGTHISPLLPAGRLPLYNIHTKERLEIAYRDSSGKYDTDALDALNWILRCHYSGKVVDMDISVIEFLNQVHKIVGGSKEIHIVSGFRSQEYNNLLLRQGREVKRNSLHIQGKAIDVTVPGVSLSALRRVAVSLRYGGVGYYRQSDFVHLDSGRFRIW
jgi:uncharacterized protein YcbK (DUF882 family)